MEKGKEITGSTIIQLKHVQTGGYLVCERKHDYNHRNCPRCPIIGQLEATSQNRKSTAVTRWQITSGMFFPKREEDGAKKDKDIDGDYD